MAQININVPDEMKVLLEETENYSELIRSLIREHYETKDNLKKKLKLLDEKSKMQYELMERQKEKILGKIEIKTKQDQKLKELEEYKKNREEELNKNIKVNFELFAGRPMSDKEFKEYKEIMEDVNLVAFIEKIQKNDKEQEGSSEN